MIKIRIHLTENDSILIALVKFLLKMRSRAMKATEILSKTIHKKNEFFKIFKKTLYVSKCCSISHFLIINA